jgi:hypothetical protein
MMSKSTSQYYRDYYTFSWSILSPSSNINYKYGLHQQQRSGTKCCEPNYHKTFYKYYLCFRGLDWPCLLPASKVPYWRASLMAGQQGQPPVSTPMIRSAGSMKLYS